MHATVLTQILLPLLLAIIMFGMGMSLTLNDFKRLLIRPKPVILGLFAQLIFMPLVAVAIIFIFALPPILAIGVVILASCPGGTSSNLICHIARANLALSITLTAFTTLICIVTSPLIVSFALDFYDTGASANFSVKNAMLGLFLVTLLPISLGLVVNHYYPTFAKKCDPWFRKGSIIFMVMMISLIVYDERATILSKINDMFAASMALCLGAIALGVGVARVFKLDKRDQVTLGIEVGLQNASMAMLIAMSFIGVNEYAIAAGIYGVTMYIGVALLIWLSQQFNLVRITK